MATILDALRHGTLELYDLPDYEQRMPERRLYVAPELWDWVDNEPRAHQRTKQTGTRTPFEHMDAMFADFRCGAKAIGNSELRRMSPTNQGVWEMHPLGLRVFGWAPAPNEFVAVSAAIVADVKANSTLYDEHLDGVLQFAKSNGLSATFVLGDYLAVFPQNH